jgi:hypothetical protein
VGRLAPSGGWLRGLPVLVLAMYMIFDSWVYIQYRWHPLDSLGTHLWHEALEPSAGFYLIGYAWGLWRWRGRGKDRGRGEATDTRVGTREAARRKKG